jgi:hypothetical protein
MTSFRSTLGMVRMGMAAALLAGAATASANVLVVRSLGPSAASYPPGRSLPDNASVTLAGQDMVVLLGRNGTRTLRGPGTYSVSGPPQSRATAYSSLMRPRERARTGSVRGGPGGAPSRSPWQIDPASGGTFCVADVGELGLWRADPHATASVNVGRAGMAGSRALEWPAGQQVLSWPASVPVQPGVDYEIVSRGRPAARIRFIPIPAAGSDRQQLAEALIEHGCQAQLDLLIASTPEG